MIKNIEKEINELKALRGDKKRLNDEVERALKDRGYVMVTLGRSKKYKKVMSGFLGEIEFEGKRYVAYGIANSMYKSRAYIKEVI